jgi:hypothetical protein
MEQYSKGTTRPGKNKEIKFLQICDMKREKPGLFSMKRINNTEKDKRNKERY